LGARTPERGCHLAESCRVVRRSEERRYTRTARRVGSPVGRIDRDRSRARRHRSSGQPAQHRERLLGALGRAQAAQYRASIQPTRLPETASGACAEALLPPPACALSTPCFMSRSLRTMSTALATALSTPASARRERTSGSARSMSHHPSRVVCSDSRRFLEDLAGSGPESWFLVISGRLGTRTKRFGAGGRGSVKRARGAWRRKVDFRASARRQRNVRGMWSVRSAYDRRETTRRRQAGTRAWPRRARGGRAVTGRAWRAASAATCARRRNGSRNVGQALVRRGSWVALPMERAGLWMSAVRRGRLQSLAALERVGVR